MVKREVYIYFKVLILLQKAVNKNKRKKFNFAINVTYHLGKLSIAKNVLRTTLAIAILVMVEKVLCTNVLVIRRFKNLVLASKK